MGFLSKIGKGLKSIAKKAVGFAAKIVKNPIIGTALSWFPATAPFMRIAKPLIIAADNVLNKNMGWKGAVAGLVEGFGGVGGVLGKAGSLLSKAGLSTVGGIVSKAANSTVVREVIGGFLGGSRQTETAPASQAASQAERYNLQQLAAQRLAQLFLQNRTAAA